MGGGGGHMGGGYGGAHGGGYGYHGGGASYHGGSWGGGYRGGWGGAGWHGNGWYGRGWYGGRGYYNRGWYGNRWGYGWGYPYWGWGVGVGWGGGYYGGGYYGGVGWDSSYGYYPDMSTYTAAPTYAPSYPSTIYVTPDGSAPDSNSSQTQQQISQLQGQVAQLQAEQRASAPRVSDVHYETVLVYRDGHTETIGNYAIVGKTVWIFSETRARKVPLSELDVPATKRDNQDRGNDFVVPR